MPDIEEVDVEEVESSDTEEEQDILEEVEESAEVEEQSEPEPEPEPKPRKEPMIPYSRFKEVNEKRKELERKLQSKPDEAKNADSKPFPKRPKLKDFNYDEDAYEAALEKWEDEKFLGIIAEREAKREQERKKQEEEVRRKELSKKWEEFVKEDEEYFNLVQEVVDSEEEVLLPPKIQSAVHKHGFQLDKYILKNRAELIPQFEQMDDDEQLVWVGQVLEKLKKEPLKEAQKQTKSKAPAPIKNVSKSGKIPEDDLLGWKIS